jgi:hypothetical protein
MPRASGHVGSVATPLILRNNRTHSRFAPNAPVFANKKQKTRYPSGYRVFLSLIALSAYWHAPLSVQMVAPQGQFVEAPGWQSGCQQLAQLAFAHV